MGSKPIYSVIKQTHLDKGIVLKVKNGLFPVIFMGLQV